MGILAALSFDYSSIDGSWNLANGWLGVGFDEIPSTLPLGDAIIDKYFVRAAGDNHTYDVYMDQDATGWQKFTFIAWITATAETGPNSAK